MDRPPKTPNEELDKFLLRMPDGLRERIKSAAELNNRSMNGEIVERLQYTFEELDAELGELLEKIARLERENAQRSAEIHNYEKRLSGWDEWATRQFSDENTLYVLLDADGYPQSWDEIVTHLQAISEASGGNIERIEAGIFDAPKVSNSKRFEQWMKLREYYRSRTHKPK
ncbi:Arc family DNA-binding protein [Rhizobium sp. AP16]|uniref:Arc family DNA-binding protein n=1 Tax=Rhizobium sp. AP16 TaxID=1144306 RepID=UPI00026ED261|nr:Arc family DNA-binding protein [Rhizobium sp. AP16]EJK83558.1 Arc-like DNA binding domain-containing protein [Rhizobium sp. AP16]